MWSPQWWACLLCGGGGGGGVPLLVVITYITITLGVLLWYPGGTAGVPWGYRCGPLGVLLWYPGGNVRSAG